MIQLNCTLLTVLTPVAGLLLLPLLKTRRVRYVVQLGMALLVVALHVINFFFFHSYDVSHALICFDSFGSPLAFVLSLLFALFALMVPKNEQSRKNYSALQFSEAMFMALFQTQQFWCFLCAWILLSLPWLLSVRENSRIFLVTQIVSVLFALAAVGLSVSKPVQTEYLLVIGICWMLAGYLRRGFFPFHFPLLRWSEHAPFATLLPMLVSQTGLYMIVKLALPILKIHGPEVLNALSVVTLFSTLYFSLLAFSQTNLRQIFCTLTLIQSSLIFCGFLHSDTLSISGANVQWLVTSLGGGGLGLVLWLIQNRTSIIDVDKYLGLVQAMPKMSATFLVFGLCLINFPMTLGFVGEDLLVHSILEHSPWWGMTILLAMGLVSITIYRTYGLLFLGTSPSLGIQLDLRKREAYGFTFLILIMTTFGFFPSTIVHLASRLIAPLN